LKNFPSIALGTPINIAKMRYQAQIIDERGVDTSTTQVVTFQPLYFFGPVGTASWLGKNLSNTTRDELFSANKDLTIQEEKDNFQCKIENSAYSGSKITFFTGVTPRVFIVAIPDTKKLTGVLKNVVSSPNLQDYGTDYLLDVATATIQSYDTGFSTQYKIYRLVFGSGFGAQSVTTPYRDVYLEITIAND